MAGKCTGGVGAIVRAKYAVDPSAWNAILTVTVGGVGGTYEGAAAPLGGFGSGKGGSGAYNSSTVYGTGGGGGSSLFAVVRQAHNNSETLI